MRIKIPSRTQSFLIAVDALILLAVTLVGFAFHNTLATSGGRPLSTWLPWTVAWLLVAPNLNVFDEDAVSDFKQVWRPFWAMILASPIAGFLRALWLGNQVNPVFVVVFGGIAALSLVAWRLIYVAVIHRKEPHG